MFSYIKIIALATIAVVIAGGLWYVSNMQANLAIAKENQVKLEKGIEEQKQVMELMKADAEAQRVISKQMASIAKQQQADMDALQKKMDSNRLANIAKSNPKALEDRVNRGSQNAVRCFELASGAPLNEKEKAAKTAKEFNNECPNYWPGTVISTE